MDIDIGKIARERRDRASLVVSTQKYGMLVIQGHKASWTEDDAKATRFKDRVEIANELNRVGLQLKYYSVIDMAE